MPIYEFACRDCRRPASLFFRNPAAAEQVRCPACGSASMERLVSRVAVLKGDRGRAESLDSGRILGGLDGNDPASFARWARKVGEQYDAELGTNYRELAEKAEAGEDPIERIDAAYSVNYQVDKRKQELAGGPVADPGEPS